MSDPEWLWNLVDNESLLWVVAVLSYGVGDTITTYWGTTRGGATEIGPIVGPLLAQFGLGGLLAVKLSSLIAFAGAWYLLWKPTRVAVPLAVAVVGGVVTIWNLAAILAPTS